MQILIGLLGLAFIANGLLMLPQLQSAIQQQVAAIYIVGGAIVFSLGVVVHRVGRISEDLGYGIKKADERHNSKV
ncbi:hypothetical protein [Agrobacterium vitis]|uniref:hypothetical protein n=1 Tax=Agrobacterium vitis TaxID=373 RepID=UPI0008DC1300|nr:hypothetical protein [Agrobacterium vitis]MUO84019.1 hypothetical protein [Agrobacterium vitis]